MRRSIVSSLLAVLMTLAMSAPALAAPPTVSPPPPWQPHILCIEGYHALFHPVFGWGPALNCIPDPH